MYTVFPTEMRTQEHEMDGGIPEHQLLGAPGSNMELNAGLFMVKCILTDRTLLYSQASQCRGNIQTPPIVLQELDTSSITEARHCKTGGLYRGGGMTWCDYLGLLESLIIARR